MARDTRAQFLREARRLEPQLRRALTDDINGIVNRVSIPDLQRAIENNDIEAIIDAIGANADTFDRTATAVRSAFVQGGGIAIATIPVGQRSPNGTLTNIVFSGNRPDVAGRIQARLDAIVVQDFPAALRQNVIDTLQEATAASRNPRSTALDLAGRLNRATGMREGGVLGLTSKDARTVQSVDAGFRDLDPDRINSYFRLKTRNKSLDGIIRREREAGRITPETRQRARAGMTNNLLFERARRFARTESLGALGEGRDAGYDRIIAEGIVDPQTIVKVWDATGDAVTRTAHQQANGQEVAYDQPFNVGGEFLQRPRDRSLGASIENTINCRCYHEVRVDYLDLRNP